MGNESALRPFISSSFKQVGNILVGTTTPFPMDVRETRGEDHRRMAVNHVYFANGD